MPPPFTTRAKRVGKSSGATSPPIYDRNTNDAKHSVLMCLCGNNTAPPTPFSTLIVGVSHSSFKFLFGTNRCAAYSCWHQSCLCLLLIAPPHSIFNLRRPFSTSHNLVSPFLHVSSFRTALAEIPKIRFRHNNNIAFIKN